MTAAWSTSRSPITRMALNCSLRWIAAKDPPNLSRSGSFSPDRLPGRLDRGAKEKSEDFVRPIYEQRHTDVRHN